MQEYPLGAQILPAPPPAHPLRDVYTGRLLILPDGTEHLLDPSLLRSEPEAAPMAPTEIHASE
jgi:hypothetical protein